MNSTKEEWKAYSSWEKVKGEYLDKWYAACREFSKVIGTERLGGNTQKDYYENWKDFFLAFYNILMLAYVKIPKIQDDNDTLEKQVRAMLNGRDMAIDDYFFALMEIGRILENLGYNSPEQKQVKNSYLSDIAQQMMEMEADIQ